MWQEIFGGGDQPPPNRAQRRAAKKEWAKFDRQRKKALARGRRIPQDGKD